MVFLKDNAAALEKFLTNPAIVALNDLQARLVRANNDEGEDLGNSIAAILKTVNSDNADEINDLLEKFRDYFIAFLILRSNGMEWMEAKIRSSNIEDVAFADLLRSQQPSLALLADLIRLSLLVTGSAGTITTAAELAAFITSTILLPAEIFGAFRKKIVPVGISDLLLVKQHIYRYDPGEIARIENILQGETREHLQTHTLTNEKETFIQTDNEVETNEELSVTDHVNLKSEIENTLKEDTKLDAGTNVKVSGSGYEFGANLGFSYNRSSTQSNKSASEIAKDVVQKTSKKVTQKIQQSERVRIIETFKEIERQAFKNGTKSPVSGIYQWLDKVYVAQVFNYGKRLQFDIMVPEPAALLIQAAKNNPADPVQPTPPDPLTISPVDLSETPGALNFYGEVIKKYRAVGTLPPPTNSITISSSKQIADEDDSVKTGGDTLKIDDGYAAQFATVIVSWKSNDNSKAGVGTAPGDSNVTVTVGQVLVQFDWNAANRVSGQDRLQAATQRVALNTAQPGQPVEERSISYSFTSNLVNGMIITVEIACVRTAVTFGNWQVQTYQKVVESWQKMQDDYEGKMAAIKTMLQAASPLGTDNPPEVNRQIEITELKRAFIAIITGADLTGTSDVSFPAAPSPVINIAFDRALEDGKQIRFFEHAFEWDKMGYVFYPYFWSRNSEWVNKLFLKVENDPLFENFLRAGYARVVVPVRPGFHDAVNFFLLTGKPWLGGDLPVIGDKTYLPISEEMKEQTGAPGDETPVGDPWEFRIPTRLIKLRKDDSLPNWQPDNSPLPSTNSTWVWKES